MKKFRNALFVLAAIVVLCNIPPFRTLFGFDDCSYATEQGSFTFGEFGFSGRDFAMCKRRFEDCKKDLGSDTLLYRLSEKRIYAFWNYREYLFSEKYHLPYKPWKEINKNRGTLKLKSGCQDF